MLASESIAYCVILTEFGLPKRQKPKTERICCNFLCLFTQKVGGFGPEKVSVSVSEKKFRYLEKKYLDTDTDTWPKKVSRYRYRYSIFRYRYLFLLDTNSLLCSVKGFFSYV